ncbi:flagellar filament capping protein FliD [uncultured Luteimonas sp.]|uniref:flagellar filament capping protein FliD n=1 Tax=uncultured Luteimonas sp. TaxID=453144 RepID=UPI00261B73D4|nr:flagellar filament capping protein FliD [uncultured Luteimonas sp.]
MASLSSPGVGSGLDVSTMVTQLVAAERAPTENRISRLESTTKSQISAFGKISSALSGLQDVLAKFAGDGALPGRKVSVSDDAGFSATANAKAALGRYGVTVETLASTHKLQSAALASDAQLGHGSLSISVGDGDPVTVEIAEGKGSLSDIRDAINKQAGSLGVSATLVRGDSGDVLVLASTTTGSEGRLTVSASGGDGGLAALGTSGGTMTVVDPGNDALVVVDGISRTSSSNRIDDLIDGLTLDLTKAKPGESFDLELKSDPSTLKAGLLNFVSAYNTALSQLRTQSAAGSEGTPGAALSGDAAPRGITQALRGFISQGYAELAALGLETKVDGSLSLDGATFDKAVAEDPAALQRLLGDEGSLRQPLAGALKSWLGDDGMISDRTSALETRMDRLESDRVALDRRMDKVQANYLRQFTALDAMVAQMSSVSSFLTQQLARLPNYSQS